MSSGACSPLFRHQIDAVEFVIGRGGSGAIFHEMGLGKTRTALEIFRRLRITDPRLNMVVVAPISLLEAAWRDEASKMSLPYHILNLHDEPVPNPDDKFVADIFTINYEAVLRKGQDLFKFVWADKKSSKSRWMIVLDESSKIKNHQAKISKILLKASPLFDFRIVMTGTPAPNTELEYWPQMKFIDPGMLGQSMTAFRAEYFHMARGKQVQAVQPFMTRQQASEVFRRGWNYAITEQKRAALMAALRPACHWAKKRDCLDLPEQVDEVRSVELASDQRSAYAAMEKRLVLEIRDQVIAAPVALTKLMKLRQITSGFVYNELGEHIEINGRTPTGVDLPRASIIVNGKRCILDLPSQTEFGNAKLRELFDVIEEVGDQQIMIWINFHWEQIKVCHELLKKFGPDSVVTMSALTEDKGESIRAFKEGRARFLVAHPASAAHGLTLVNCALQIFFSVNYSLEQHEQARARIHRAGQTQKCTYIYLIARNTIDEKILATLKDKGDAQRIVYDIIRGKD